MNKKLRLLVTNKCPNKCPKCCNNNWDLNKLPVVDTLDYEEIMLTGGEPLLFSDKIVELLNDIRFKSNAKLYVYTACFNTIALLKTIQACDGIVLTPHKAEDIEIFVKHINQHMLYASHLFINKSLRLNLFPDMTALLPKNIDLSLWQVKQIEWVDDCPVPEGEDFKRLTKLYE